MKDLEINGTRVRVTKYKIVIFEDKEEISEEQAGNIAVYLRNEGFIKKDEIAVEIININE